MSPIMWAFTGALGLFSLVCVASVVAGMMSLERLRKLKGHSGFAQEAELHDALFALAVYSTAGILVVAVVGTVVDLVAS